MVFFNFFSVGSLIPFFFMAIIGYFFLKIQNRSRASLNLGLTFALALGSMGFAYFIATSIYHPWGAYHRYITVAATLFGVACGADLYFHFPHTIYPKAEKYFLWIHGSISTIVLVLFIVLTWNADILYNFGGTYFDFDHEFANKFSASFIIFSTLIFLIAGIWRTIITKGSEKWIILLLHIFIINIPLIAGIANSMSREGALERVTFHTYWDLITVIFGFGATVTYINYTKDKTSFMVKIVGICLALVLLIFQIVSFYTLKDRDEFYDSIHLAQIARMQNEADYRPDDYSYRASYSLTNDTITSDKNKDELGFSISDHRVDFLNTNLYASLDRLDSFNIDSIKKTLENAHPEFSGYKSYILSHIEKGKINNRNDLKTAFDKLSKVIRQKNIKFQTMNPKDFRKNLETLLLKEKGDFVHFIKPISDFISSSSQEGVALKKEVLTYVSPVNFPGTRMYRGNPKSMQHFVVYHTTNKNRDRIVEYGFSNIEYRKFIHPAAEKLVILLFGIMGAILIGFRFFFQGALVNPLEKLLDGVKKVNQGNLDIQVPVKVEDEIGFLTRSFNSMVESIRSAKKDLQDYAENLEHKVNERTAELVQTLEEVQELKTKQDGDYYLTSLLIKPLGINRATSKNVNIKFFIKQKKQFQFKHWTEEIGGDICVSQTINLQDRKYVVFLNADAMGKSIQGAGGALVLGSVFESILERTRTTESIKKLYPERWMKNTFIELHKIFESFNGSMLVSLAMGLIDEETGFTYYINAEHPFTILYRDGVASFIEDDMYFRKAGTPGLASSIFIKTFSLMPGDILIAGSDGRDDLLIGNDASGSRIINEDETLILRNIEKADADLDVIYGLLKETGEVTDDLSMIRIGFKEGQDIPESDQGNETSQPIILKAREEMASNNYQSAEKLYLQAFEEGAEKDFIHRELAKLHIKEKNYKKALEHAQEVVSISPKDTNFIYITSYCHKKLGNFEEAIDLSERVRLRNPEMVKNLIHLIEVYLKSGNTSRAKSIAMETSKFEMESIYRERLDRIIQSLN